MNFSILSSCTIMFSSIIIMLTLTSVATAKTTATSTNPELKANSTNHSSRSRSARTGFDPQYGIWGQNNSPYQNHLTGFGRQDMIPLIPIALLFGLGLMLIPFLSSFIAQVLSPPPPAVYTGRKKRSADSSSSPGSDLLSETVVSYLKMLQKSVEKHGFNPYK